LALDLAGNVFVAGQTRSADFPGTAGGAQALHAADTGDDTFVAKLNNGLTTLIQATYLGGSRDDEATALAVDGLGNVFVAGGTGSADFPGTAGGSQSSFGAVFAAKLDNNLATLIQATFLGSGGSDLFARAAYTAGNLFVAGNIQVTGLPGAVGGAQSTPGGGLDAFIVKVTGNLLATSGPPNYQGLWWNAPAGSESGWGINFAHQGDVIFATWFTYDLAGNGMWLAMTATKTADSVYKGTLFLMTGGPAFDTVPFPPLGSPGGASGTSVGIGTLTFTDANSGSFAYTVAGISQTKAITPQDFGPRPTCTFGTQVDLASASNYQDLWWAAPAGSEAGWGVNLTHQGDTIFATWFTYDHDRAPMWLIVSAAKTAVNTYTGTLLRTTGPPFNSRPFPPTGTPGGATGTAVGTATFIFSDGNTATFGYTVDGVTQTKNITREVFQPPAGTVCD
jgi:hypothetical protein